MHSMVCELRSTALGYFVIGANCLWSLGSSAGITLVLWLLSGDMRARAQDGRSALRGW
jgi:hypothetical protein